jgi:ectoine hydroxylase-related dioxygenase (phytanoyl-CoA dioxygenase family)
MSQDAQTLISDDDVGRFRRDGAVVLRQVFTQDWLDRLAQGIERNLRLPGPMAIHYTGEDSPGRFFGDYCNWRRIPQYRYFITRSPAAEMAARLMGSEHAQFFHEHVLVKEPGTEEPTPWHHDLPYYCVDGDDTVSIWTPMDPVPEHVCPKFVAGSHRWDKLFYPRMFKDGENYDYKGAGYEPVPDIEGNPGDYEILSWSLEWSRAMRWPSITRPCTTRRPIPGRGVGGASRIAGWATTCVSASGRASPRRLSPRWASI